jgi:predicted acyl esterase
MEIKKILIMLLFCIAVIFPVSQADAAKYPIKVTQHWITTYDGYKLDCDVYAPKSGVDLPLIIFSPSWGLPKIEYLFPARKMAAEGYIAVSYSARGWFNSTGKINVGEENDMRDISTIIDFVLEKYPADARNIGVAGISMGACRSLQIGIYDSRVKAVASLSGTAVMRDALYPQDTPNKSWSSTETGGDTNMIGDRVIDLEQGRNVDDILEWLDDISPFRLIDDYARTNGRLSVYISNYYADPLFSPNSVMDFYSLIDIPDKIIDLNDGMHAFPVGYGCLSLPEITWDTVYKWFDYYLKGIDAGISDRLARTPVSFGLKDEKTRLYFSSWPTEQIKYRNYYLNLDGLKSLSTGRGSLEGSPQFTLLSREIKSGDGSKASLGPYDTISQMLNVDTGLNIFNLDKDYALTHISAAAADETIIAGIPILDISVTPSKKDAQVIAYLYDVNPLGYGDLISHSAWTLLNVKPWIKKRLSFEFQALAFRLKKNHRLAVVFDTYDKRCGFPDRPDYRVKFNYCDKPVLKIPVTSVKPL